MPDRELEYRVAAVEARGGDLAEQVQAAREDATAARHVAAANDRDVTEIRAELWDSRQATTSSFNTLCGDLADLRNETRNDFHRNARQARPNRRRNGTARRAHEHAHRSTERREQQ